MRKDASMQAPPLPPGPRGLQGLRDLVSLGLELLGLAAVLLAGQEQVVAADAPDPRVLRPC